MVKSNRKANSCSGDEQPRNKETLFSETHNHSILTSFPTSYHCLRESTLRETHSWSFTLACLPFQLHWAWCLNSSSLKWFLLPLQRNIRKHRKSYNLQDTSSISRVAEYKSKTEKFSNNWQFFSTSYITKQIKMNQCMLQNGSTLKTSCSVKEGHKRSQTV